MKTYTKLFIPFIYVGVISFMVMITMIVVNGVSSYLKDKVEFFFDTPVLSVVDEGKTYKVICKDAENECDKCIISVGRSGSKWMESVCKELNIATKSNRVDIGVRVELPAAIFDSTSFMKAKSFTVLKNMAIEYALSV